MSATKPRYDFYQTDTAVNLSVFVKGLSESDVDCRFGQHSLSLTLKPATSPEPQALELQLFEEIDPSNSAYKILSTKVDVVLQKRNPGRRWTQLEAIAGGSVPSYENATASSSSSSVTPVTSSAPSSSSSVTPASSDAPIRRNKWDSLSLDDEDDEDEEGAEPGSKEGKKTKKNSNSNGIDDFFQSLYANADDDTKRAMMKSYQESGGTSLSTNWKEVGSKRMEVQAPKGMEARKW